MRAQHQPSRAQVSDLCHWVEIQRSVRCLFLKNLVAPLKRAHVTTLMMILDQHVSLCQCPAHSLLHLLNKARWCRRFLSKNPVPSNVKKCRRVLLHQEQWEVEKLGIRISHQNLQQLPAGNPLHRWAACPCLVGRRTVVCSCQSSVKWLNTRRERKWWRHGERERERERELEIVERRRKKETSGRAVAFMIKLLPYHTHRRRAELSLCFELCLQKSSSESVAKIMLNVAQWANVSNPRPVCNCGVCVRDKIIWLTSLPWTRQPIYLPSQGITT